MRDLCFIITIFLFFLHYIEIGCDSDESEKEGCAHNSGKSIKFPCDENKLIQFLADIQIINPESIVELAVDSLGPMCRRLCRSLEKLDDYLRKCKLQSEDDLYLSLITGVKVLRDKLCTDSEFYARYQCHYHCLHELRNDFEGCNAPADWNEETDNEEICTDYKNMIDCYYIKAAKVCGLEPAATIKELIKDVVNSIIKVKCSGINKNPYVKDPMPAAYMNHENNKAETVKMCDKMLMSLSILILYFIKNNI